MIRGRIKGQSMIELLLALGILAFIMTAVFTLVFSGLTTSLASEQTNQASLLARDGLEAIRSIRDRDWGEFLSANDAPNTHGVSTDSGIWEWIGTSDITDGKYNREITVENVNRSPQGNIVTSGGTNDDTTKKVTVKVSWNNLFQKNVILSAYFTSWNYL